VLGELLAGVVLGPTLLGHFFPQWQGFVFPSTGNNPIVLDGLTTVAIALFLLVAGIEVDLSTIWRQGKTAALVGIWGMLVPFGMGLAMAWYMPRVLGRTEAASALTFALFFATAMSISALPVIAKTLMDLYLYRSDMGMIVIAAAIFNDIVGWIVFAIILGMMGTASGQAHMSIGWTIGLTLGFAGFMLTIGRWLIDRALVLVQAYATWPGGVLGFALSLALFGAAFTEWIGVHAIFGSFLVGVAIGDSPHLRERTRTTIDQFISFIFAPLFFASVGLRVNFAANFDFLLVLIVLVVACAGKILGCSIGARMARMPKREAWAVAFGMNARGSMEIILGLLALQFGLIHEQMFVALVVMALVTSMISGPAMQRLLQKKRPLRLVDFVQGKAFLGKLKARDRRGAIRELAEAVAGASQLSADAVDHAVWRRERTMSTGLRNGVAVPHARLYSLNAPLVGVGFSEEGIDFDASDGEPAHVIFLMLTPASETAAQLHLLRDIARTFQKEGMVGRAMETANATEFMAMLNANEVKPAS